MLTRSSQCPQSLCLQLLVYRFSWRAATIGSFLCYLLVFFPTVREWQQHFCCFPWQLQHCELGLSSAAIKLMVQYIYIFHQDWLEDQPLMNNTSGTAHWYHWRELCSSRFPVACSCFNRSQRGREQQQTAPLPALYCYCWSCFQNAQRPTAGNAINYPDDSWWEQTGTGSHVRDPLTDSGKERCGCV